MNFLVSIQAWFSCDIEENYQNSLIKHTLDCGVSLGYNTGTLLKIHISTGQLPHLKYDVQWCPFNISGNLCYHLGILY